jgi:pSer/pThr/pTyr-binding forkhead associated (FHA) protein
MIYLTVTINGEIQNDYVLDKDVVTIGRAPENDVCIENIGISTHHARITSANLQLEDLDSVNHTYVNDQKVQTQQLENGDVIKVRKYKIRFFHSGEREMCESLPWQLSQRRLYHTLPVNAGRTIDRLVIWRMWLNISLWREPVCYSFDYSARKQQVFHSTHTVYL